MANSMLARLFSTVTSTTTPSWRIIERECVDPSETWVAQGTRGPASGMRRALVVRLTGVDMFHRDSAGHLRRAGSLPLTGAEISA